jgi:hypothetical protein
MVLCAFNVYTFFITFLLHKIHQKGEGVKTPSVALKHEVSWRLPVEAFAPLWLTLYNDKLHPFPSFSSHLYLATS